MIIPSLGSWMSLSVGRVAELRNWSCSYNNIATMCCTICQNSAQHKRETLGGNAQWLLQNKQTDKQTNKQRSCLLLWCVSESLSGISGMAWTRRAYLLQTCVVEEELHPPAGEKAKRKFQNAHNTCMMSVHSNLWNHCDASLCSYTAVFLQNLLLSSTSCCSFHSTVLQYIDQSSSRGAQASNEREREREREKYNKTTVIQAHAWMAASSAKI
jgi:hypothetical protein